MNSSPGSLDGSSLPPFEHSASSDRDKLDPDEDLFFDDSGAPLGDPAELPQLAETEEPDDEALSFHDEDLEDLTQEDTFKLLNDPRLVTEISEDPVRLYLKEIGNIDLLDSDQEFWLSTRLEGAKRLDLLGRQHPLARSPRRAVASQPGTSPIKTRSAKPSPRNLYHALFEELATSWARLSSRYGSANDREPESWCIPATSGNRLDRSSETRPRWTVRTCCWSNLPMGIACTGTWTQPWTNWSRCSTIRCAAGAAT